MRVPSNDNPADLMTKWFTIAQHGQLAAAVGLCRTWAACTAKTRMNRVYGNYVVMSR